MGVITVPGIIVQIEIYAKYWKYCLLAIFLLWILAGGEELHIVSHIWSKPSLETDFVGKDLNKSGAYIKTVLNCQSVVSCCPYVDFTIVPSVSFHYLLSLLFPWHWLIGDFDRSQCIPFIKQLGRHHICLSRLLLGLSSPESVKLRTVLRGCGLGRGESRAARRCRAAKASVCVAELLGPSPALGNALGTGTLAIFPSRLRSVLLEGVYFLLLLSALSTSRNVWLLSSSAVSFLSRWKDSSGWKSSACI